MIQLTLAAIFLGAVSASMFHDSPGELGKEFDAAQKLMVVGDFDGAVAAYENLINTPSSLFLWPSRVKVEVRGERLLLRVAAAYQVAGSYRRRGEEELQKDDGGAARGRESLRQAARYYHVVSRDSLALEDLRQRAAYQEGKSYFSGEDYEQAAAAFESFRNRFPHGEYALDARYHLAWSTYRMGSWERAAAEFRAVAAAEPGSDRALRALFQLGECLERLQRWEEALDAFQQLAQHYDPQAYDGRRRVEDLMQVLRKDFLESERELLGKAHLRVGDGYRHLDSLETAMEWYRRAAQRFPTEGALVKTAYLRLAEIHADAGRTDAALTAYRTALEEVVDPLFRAQVQAELMMLAHEAGRFEESAAAHRFYIQAFGEHAGEAGISLQQAQLRVGEALRQEAVRRPREAERDSLYGEALAAYRELLQMNPPDSLAAEALLGSGFCLQSLDEGAAAQAQYEAIRDNYGATRSAAWAQLQLARIHSEGGDWPATMASYQALLQIGDGELRDIARVELALLYQRRQKKSEALALLRAIEPTSAEFSRAQLALVRLHTAGGDWEEARQVLTRAKQGKLGPSVRAELDYTEAEIAFQARDYGATLEFLARVDTTLLQDPFAYERLYVRGVSSYQVGDYAAALEQLVAYCGRSPLRRARQQAIRVIGLCLAETVDQDSAVRRFRRWAAASASERLEWDLGLARYQIDTGRHAEALEVLDRLEMGSPDLQQQVLLLRGIVRMAKNEWAPAREVFLGMETDGLSGPDIQRRLFLLGVAAMNLADYGGALKHLQELLASKPPEDLALPARLYLGKSFFALGRHREAAEHLLQLVEDYGGHVEAGEAAYLAGDNLYLVEDYRGAATAYARVEHGKFMPAARLARAWCLLELKEEGPFLEALEKVRKAHPHSPEARTAAMMAGDYYYSSKKYAAARQAYRTLIEQHPGSEEAARARSRFVDLEDLEADRLYQEAMAAFDGGDYEGARRQLEAVAERFPGTLSEVAARCNIGVCYEKTGQWRRAVAVYDSLLKIEKVDPQFGAMVRFAREHRDWIRDYRL